MNKKHFSFVVIPPGGKGSISFKLNRWVLNLLIFVFIAFIFSLAGTFYFTTQMGAEIAQIKKQKKQMAYQNEVMNRFSLQIEELKGEIEDLVEKDTEIKTLLGDTKKYNTRRKRATYKRLRKKKTAAFERDFKILADLDASIEEKYQAQIQFLKEHIEKLKASISEQNEKVRQMRDRFAYTPSIWPVYGRILSSYGWRTHPITGRRRFHKGIDIPSWRGAPIKATADGIVKYAGWSGTYGNVVVIDHNFGYRTVYAHCSPASGQ